MNSKEFTDELSKDRKKYSTEEKEALKNGQPDLWSYSDEDKEYFGEKMNSTFNDETKEFGGMFYKNYDKFVERSRVLFYTILYDRFSKEARNEDVIKNDIKMLNNVLPSDYVEKMYNQILKEIKKSLFNADNRYSSGKYKNTYTYNDDSLSKSEKDKIWNGFVKDLNSEKSINMYDDLFLSRLKDITNYMDRFKNEDIKSRQQEKASETQSSVFDYSRDRIYELYEKYRNMYDQLNEFLNNKMVNKNFISTLFSNECADKIKKQVDKTNVKDQKYTDFAFCIIELLYSDPNEEVDFGAYDKENSEYAKDADEIMKANRKAREEEKKKTNESVLYEDNDISKEKSTKISDKNAKWIVSMTEQSLDNAYKSAEEAVKVLPDIDLKKTISPQKTDVKGYLSGLKNLLLIMSGGTSSEKHVDSYKESLFIQFGVLEKVKTIVENQYRKIFGKSGSSAGNKLGSDHLENFYHIMGRYPMKSDVDEYEKIRKMISERIDITKDLINRYEYKMSEKYFYSPTDYSITVGKRYDKKLIETLIATASLGDATKKFLEKCEAYRELSLLSKEKENVKGQKIAKEIVGNNEISDRDLGKLFIKVHAVSKKMNVSDMITLFVNMKDITENYKYAQGYTVSRFTRQRPIIISDKDDNVFICTFNFISYENIRDIMRKFGSVSDELQSLATKRNRPKFVG